MNPRPDMTFRIAARLGEQDLRAILQDLIQLAQEEFPETMSEELRAAIDRAKLALTQGVQ